MYVSLISYIVAYSNKEIKYIIGGKFKMTQKEIDHIRKRDSWREIIAKQKESGKSIAAYCRENNITPNQFWYWQKTITKELISDAQMVGVLNTPVTISGADEVAATAKEVVSKVVKKTTSKTKKSKQPATLAPVVNAIVHGEKEIDTQAQLSVDGVVFDMEHNRLYVPGSATEKTIGVAISIHKGLLPHPVRAVTLT